MVIFIFFFSTTSFYIKIYEDQLEFLVIIKLNDESFFNLFILLNEIAKISHATIIIISTRVLF